jgi:prolipoprotein diacylglyceryl transferase
MLTWGVNPVLIDFGPIEIRYYGVFFAIALMLAYYLGRKMVLQKKLSLDMFDSLTFYLVLGLIIGARFGHILFYELDYYLANPAQIIKIWQGGLSSHGATIGVILAYGLFLWRNRKNKVRFFDFADIIVIITCIPAALVRLGNFFNSELVGRPSDAPWAVTFERVDMVARHPSQIYEFLMGAVIFLILYSLWALKYGKRFKAKIFKNISPRLFVGLFFVLYFAGRFTVEFFKYFPLHENFFNLTTGQILSLPFLVVGIGLVIKQMSTTR